MNILGKSHKNYSIIIEKYKRIVKQNRGKGLTHYTARYRMKTGTHQTTEDRNRGQNMDNREVILETALELFYTRGYDAVGVQAVSYTHLNGVFRKQLYRIYRRNQRDCY